MRGQEETNPDVLDAGVVASAIPMRGQETFGGLVDVWNKARQPSP